MHPGGLYSQSEGRVGDGVRGQHLTEPHVAAHHPPFGRRDPGGAFRPPVIWLRRAAPAAADAEQQDRKQLQQIHPHVHTPPVNRSSIWSRKDKKKKKLKSRSGAQTE